MGERVLAAIGFLRDPVFRHVTNRMKELGRTPKTIDIGDYLRSGVVSYDEVSGVLRFSDARQRAILEADAAVYVRLVDFATAAPSQSLAVRAERIAAVLRVALQGAAGRRLVNPLDCDNTNYSKFYHQHSLATMLHGHGVAVPETLLTNLPADAEEFVTAARSLYKGASAQKTIATEWREADRARLGDVSLAPVLFQRIVPGPDLRIHVIGESCFGEIVWSQSLDYRFPSKGHRNRYQRVDLPADLQVVAGKIAQMTGCPFMGIDFKLDVESGRVFFLEANSMPAFVGYDRRAGGAISRTLVEFLDGTAC